MFDIHKIIPPSDYQHREGFTNEHLIDNLSDADKLLLEDVLINMLLNSESLEGPDTLITESLAYLMSEKAVPVMMAAIDHCIYEMCRLSIYASIFQINSDENMLELAISSFRKLEKVKDQYHIFTLIDSFYFLSKFKRLETNSIIENYIDHKDFLVSYNAKRSLGIIID